MKKVFLTLIFVSLFILPLNSISEEDSANRRDGSFWAKYDVSFRFGYIMGLSEGLYYCAGWVDDYKQMTQDDINPLGCCDALWGFGYFVSQYEGNISYGQMFEGVDEFYKDYRNTQIPILALFKLVKMEVEGKSKAEIDSVARELRSRGFSKKKR